MSQLSRSALLLSLMATTATLVDAAGPSPTAPARNRSARPGTSQRHTQPKVNPRVAARQAGARVAASEESVWDVIREIQELSVRFDPRDLTMENALIDNYRTRLIPMLLADARALLERRDEFDEAFRAYMEALGAAPQAFRDAASEYQAFADAETDEYFSAKYDELADQAELYARAMAMRQEEMQKLYEDIDDRTRFVARSVVFLERFDEFLSLVPDLKSGDELQLYLQKLNEFAEQLKAAIESFGLVGDKLRVLTTDKSAPVSAPAAQPKSNAPLKPGTVLQPAPRRQTTGTSGSPSDSRQAALNRLSQRLASLAE